MSNTKQKIIFHKKIPVMKTVQNKVEKKQFHQMRFVALQSGEIVHCNDSFAATLDTVSSNLRGRFLLDTVLFDDFKESTDDRIIFNSLSQGEDTGVKSVRAGEHILLMGKNRDRIPFHFDWVKGRDDIRYLVACSLDEKGKPLLKGEQPDWDSILGKLVPSNSQPVSLTRMPSYVTGLDKTDIEMFFAINDSLMCVIDIDCNIVRFNEEFQGKISIGAGDAFISHVHRDDRPAVRQYLQSLTNHDPEEGLAESPVEFEARIVTTNDEVMWINWRVVKARTMLYCLGNDITAAKMSEINLHRREQELSEAQKLAHMGHWRWTVGDTKIEWSEHLYDIFDIQDSNFTPTLSNLSSLLHRRDVGRMMQAFQRAIIEQNDYDLDFRIVRTNGAMRYIRCEGRCELDDEGDVIALYGVMQDITEQTENEMELREAKDAAEQAYAAKSRFLANMSHELRTPLNAIIGFSDMIQRQMLGPLGADKYADYAMSIKESGEHLLDLITDILDMSKIEAGKYELDLEKIQLGAIVKTAVRMIESRAHEGILELDCQVARDEPIIIADRRAVMQILLNVLSNAVKFTEPGGKITIFCDEFDNHISLQIKDTGIGIPANKLNAVMRPFEQVSTAFTRNHEGSGLGLAISKELAELHGGMLTIDSDVGCGTMATLRLPRDASQKPRKNARLK